MCLRVYIVSNAASRFLLRRIPDQIHAPSDGVLGPRTINFDLPLFPLRVRHNSAQEVALRRCFKKSRSSNNLSGGSVRSGI